MEVTFDSIHGIESVFNVSSHMPFSALGFASFPQKIQKHYHIGTSVLSPSSVFLWWVSPGSTQSLSHAPAGWERESLEQKQQGCAQDKGI